MTAAVDAVADVFPPRPSVDPEAASPVPVAKPARVRARSGSRMSGVPAVLAGAARTFVADVAGAWPWRGTPPTLAELVAARVPDRDRVPSRNLGLWLGWAAYNHAVIVVFAVAYPVLWVLAHPARFVLAAVLAVLALIWI